jgi:hypothetical protein
MCKFKQLKLLDTFLHLFSLSTYTKLTSLRSLEIVQVHVYLTQNKSTPYK